MTKNNDIPRKKENRDNRSPYRRKRTENTNILIKKNSEN